jgi:hypothetical protein
MKRFRHFAKDCYEAYKRYGVGDLRWLKADDVDRPPVARAPRSKQGPGWSGSAADPAESA